MHSVYEWVASYGCADFGQGFCVLVQGVCCCQSSCCASHHGHCVLPYHGEQQSNTEAAPQQQVVAGCAWHADDCISLLLVQRVDMYRVQLQALRVGVQLDVTHCAVCCGVQLMWIGFGVVWDLRLLGLIDTRTEEVAYLCCDFSAKVRIGTVPLPAVAPCTCTMHTRVLWKWMPQLP
jgi:hypothetical protein